MSYTIKDLERYGYETFETTMIDRHPDWTITSSNDLETENPSYIHYDVDVYTPEDNHYRVEIKTRPEYTINSFPDLQIDEHKVLDLQKDLKENKCDRAFLCGIYPKDEEMLLWEIKGDRYYEAPKSYRPKKTLETEKVEFVLKAMVSFPIESAQRIRIKSNSNEQ